MSIAYIASMAITAIPVSMAISIAGLSISRPLAISITMVSIASMAISNMTVSMSVSTESVSGLSYGSRFSLSVSRPLAISKVSMVAMAISYMAISMAVSMAISTVSRLSHDHSEEGEREGGQKF